MTYTAWSDGSYMDSGKSYIAYIIVDKKNKEIATMKAEVKGLNTSYEAEFAAMYYLFKKVIHLGLKDIQIFTDCLTLYTNLKKKRKRKMRYEEDLVKRMENKMGVDNIGFLLNTINWQRREKNMAHPLFHEAKREHIIEDFIKEFGKMIRTSKRYKRQNPAEYVQRQKQFLKKQKIEKMCWAGKLIIRNSVGTFKMPLTCLSTASKILNTKTQKETLKKLEKKMEKAIVEKRGKETIYRKGRLEIFVENGIIHSIKIVKRNYADSYREKGREIYIPFDIEKTIKKSKRCKETITLEGFDYPINKRAYNALKKRMPENRIREFLVRNMESGLIVHDEKATIYVKGRTHLVVHKNTLINLTFSLSNHTQDWMKRQKSA